MPIERLHRAFAKRKALITYLMAGDGDTVAHAVACAENGADVIELGFPFSDPIADGPVIQRAAHRSLAAGTTLQQVLDVAANIRTKVEVPLVLMGYLNPILRYGVEPLLKQATKAGVDGFIVPDLPPDEASLMQRIAAEARLGLSFLVAPTSTPEREQLVAQASSGFVYCVSVTGVTGARNAIPELRPQVARVRAHTSSPIAIGFGISGPEQAVACAQQADGVIVGSAIVDRIERGQPLAPFIQSLRNALETPC
jgi:tryptophan synthase alpha chain